MELVTYVGIVVVVFILFVITAIQSKKRAVETMRAKIEKQWGKLSEREYEQQEYDKIADYYRKHLEEGNGQTEVIDDITWNDLDLDLMFMAMNTTYSSAGEEYLYKILRMPEQQEQVLKERDRLVVFFQSHRNETAKLQEIFYLLGRTKRISLTEFISRLYELPQKSNFIHYLLDGLLLISLVTLFIEPVFGILGIVIMLIENIATYYSRKAEVESYFICFQYLVQMQNAAKKLTKEGISELEEYSKQLEGICKTLSQICKGSFLLASTNLSGSLEEIIMEYVRMITHVDLIKFNSMLKMTKAHVKDIDALFTILGKIESAIAIASFRESLSYYVKPKLQKEGSAQIYFEELYHPLISEPVANSMREKKSVLLTGSNASGKSTFLKTVALNAIFAQTIYTCMAKSYQSPYYSIYTSMALRDNLQGQESYYIVEIKSLKRIVDAIHSKKHVLCFVDEVLRGTNTIERIATSSHILRHMAEQGAMCFAATHDVELTNILENIYANYHFQEEVQDDDVLFDYKLYPGRAVSRNAIKLLKMMGYDDRIVKGAQESAEQFLKDGVWSIGI